MGNNLIHNYLNNSANDTSSTQRRSERNRYMPSVSSTMSSFDQSSDKLIKPLDGKGHLVNGSLTHMPKEFIRDTVYTTRALADGVRGKANDHQLGKLNDLGLKLGGIAIATYLMTRKGTLKTKAMEFVGFGAFLASMALWPKVALEIPARIIHGFNFRKKYIDEQGRKKEVSIDPNYIPFDLYKGDKKSEDLDIIGDRAGIKRDIPNRHEAVKDHIRKVSVQNNTLWMMTVGLAAPLMTALACNRAEKYITPMAENYTNKKVNKQVDELDKYLAGRMDKPTRDNYEEKVLKLKNNGTKDPKSIESVVGSLKGKCITKEEMINISETLTKGFDAEMKDAARSDIESLLGGERYIANAKSADRLTSSIHSVISAKDAELASKISPEKIKTAVSQGIIQGAVRDMLTDVGVEILDKEPDFTKVSNNFKCREVSGLDFFKVTEETKNMSPVDRLAHNIKSIVMKVNNSNSTEDFVSGMSDLEVKNSALKGRIDAKLQADSEAIARKFYSGELAISSGRENYIRQAVGNLYKSEAPKEAKYKSLFTGICDVLKADTSSNRGFVLSEKSADTILDSAKHLRKFNAIDGILTESAHFKVEKASETIVANNWKDVSDTLVKELGITDKELSVASKDKVYSKQLFTQKLEQICSDEEKYKDFITKLGKKMIELDEKMDAPNSDSTGRMMNKIESGIGKNCTDAGEHLGQLGMSEMKKRMVSSKCSKLGGIHTGSLMNSKIERIHSRVDGVHSSYMRLLETAEFFHRAQGYEQELAANGGNLTEAIAKKYGMTQNKDVNTEVISRGKDILLDAHTNKFYTKMGLHHNENFFNTLLWSLYRPNRGKEWNEGWSQATEDTIKILDGIKSPDGTLDPRRVFEGVERIPLGQKLKEHMNHVYNSMGSITRGVLDPNKETIRVKEEVSQAERRACKRFDLLGKAPADLLHDTLKQTYNSRKWMKTFAPILAGTFGVTLLAQFFFGKKDPDIKA